MDKGAETEMLGLILGLMIGACGMGIQAGLWKDDARAKAKMIVRLKTMVVNLVEEKRELERMVDREKAANEILMRELRGKK
jgi:hypothetical protein